MQIPSNSTNSFIKSITEKGEKVRSLFSEHVNSFTKKVQLKVMLGDGTVQDQESFDPALVRQFYDTILRKLSNWTNHGVSVSTDKDLRRIFIKFEVKEGNYLLSAYMSLQYHALLFYKPVHKVIEIQQELAELTDKIKDLQEAIAFAIGLCAIRQDADRSARQFPELRGSFPITAARVISATRGSTVAA